MKLDSLINNLYSRTPGFAISTKLKVVYVTYIKMRCPKKISSTFDSPVSNAEALRMFNDLLHQWGLTDTSDWHLCIDAREEYFLPHEEMPEVLENLNFKDITIYVSSVSDITNVPYNIEVHPTSCIILRHWYDVLQKENIDWDNVGWDRHFIILARKPTQKRVLMVKHMLDTYKENTICSCGSRDISESVGRRPITVKFNKDPDRKIDNNAPKNNWVTTAHYNIDFASLMHPYPYPMSIEDGPVTEIQGQIGTDYNFFNNALNIICETMEEDWQPVNLSEKTFKAFGWYQIPIWHGSPNTVAEVRKLGFDVFDDIIDHGYDSMTQYDIRREMVLKEIGRFKEKYDTLDSLAKLRKELLPRLRSNDQRVLHWVNQEKEKYDPVLLNVANPID